MKTNNFTHGSLFSGIGGFDLAAELMGWENKFHCEWNEFGQKVLKYYWPNAESFHDITKTDFTPYANRISILSGGFPCQPYSLAGKRKGKEDERHLFPEMLRAIKEIQPRWVVGENVLGLVNWNGGLVFHEVQADLEAAGYEVWPYVLPAAAVNAPHRRDRVWFIAHRNSNGQHWSNSEHEVNPSEGREYAQRNIEQGTNHGFTSDPAGQQGERMRPEQREFSEPKQGESGGRSSEMGNERNAINTNSERRKKRNISGKSREQEQFNWGFNENQGNWQKFPTQSPVCNGNDGIPARLDGITFSKWRNESIKAGGNAIVPQVALQIFKAIQKYEQLQP
jgi:DNA (cytosine-5)-methyltransferase 1